MPEPQETAQRAKALLDGDRALASIGDACRVLDATVETVRQALRLERCSLMMIDPRAGELVMTSATGVPPEQARRIRVKLGEGVAGTVAQTGKAILVQDVRDTKYYNPERAERYDNISFICAPIFRRGEVAGVINCTNRIGGEAFTPEDMAVINALTGFVSLALENVVLLDTTQNLQELLHDLLDSLTDAVVAMDSRGTVTCWNVGAERLLAISEADAVGGDFLEMAPPPAAAKLREAISGPAGSGLARGLEIEWPGPSPELKAAPLGVTLSQLKRADGTLDGYVMVFEDLSLRREVTELKRVDEIKSNFIAMISHELRTPLTSMRGSIHLLTSLIGNGGDATSKQLLDILRSNTERLIYHVNNLLEVTQIQNHSVMLRPDSYDLCAMVDACAVDLRGSATARGVTVTVSHEQSPLPVYADIDKIKLVIRHLLDNAIKFSRLGGAVQARTMLDGGTGKLWIKDSGSGISKEDVGRLFNRFIQLEPTMTRGSGGAGLGLYIARELTRLHGGSLEIARTGPEGTEFVLTLPRERPGEAR